MGSLGRFTTQSIEARLLALMILETLLSVTSISAQSLEKPQDYPFLGQEARIMISQMGRDYDYEVTKRGLRQYAYLRKRPDLDGVESEMDIFATCGDIVIRHTYSLEWSSIRWSRRAFEKLVAKFDRMLGAHRNGNGQGIQYLIWDSDPSLPLVTARHNTDRNAYTYIMELSGRCE